MTWLFGSWRLAATAMLSCLLGLGACGDGDDVSNTRDEDEAQDEGNSGGSKDEGESDRSESGASEDDDDAQAAMRDAAIDSGRSPAKDAGVPAEAGRVAPAVDGGTSAPVDGGAPVLDGGAPVLDGGATQGSSREDLGEGDGKDVLMIGDSWMSLGSANSGIQGGLLKASSQPYRTYGIGGTTLLGGGAFGGLLATIPTQYQNAIADNADVKTVIMTGGGNDILQTGLEGDCEMEGEACTEQVVKVLDTLSMLWATMAEDGVQDLVYILYATPEGKSVDFALPDGDSAPARCAKVPAPMRCHILPTVDIVMGDIPDDIHPSQAASDRIGEAVYDLMTQQGMRR